MCAFSRDVMGLFPVYILCAKEHCYETFLVILQFPYILRKLIQTTSVIEILF